MVIAAALVALTVTLLRRTSWLGDLLALALPAACVVLGAVIIGVLADGGPAGLVAGLAGLLAGSLVTIALPRRRVRVPLPVDTLLLASVNLQYDSDDPTATVRSAIEIGADVLVVTEVTTQTDALLTAAFPYRIVTHEALRARDNGVAVYSHVPITERAALPRFGREALRVHVLGRHPFVLYAVHLPRPVIQHDGSPGLLSLAAHRRSVRALDDAARDEAEPVVIAGDLNLADRTSGYRVLRSGRVDAMRSAWPRATYAGAPHWRLLALRIDHLLLPRDWSATEAATFTIHGSDHRGIRARIGPRG